jgi:hypothetical protein
VSGRAGWRACIKWYQSKKIYFLSVEEKKEIHHAAKEMG